jgi:hypothetical protein
MASVDKDTLNGVAKMPKTPKLSAPLPQPNAAVEPRKGRKQARRKASKQ